ncbi:MAG: 3-dehydroquinate synthase [Bacteroidota bacterium]
MSLPENVLLSSDPATDLKNFLSQKKYSKITLLADENTFLHCYPLIRQSLPEHKTIKVKSGEEHKTLETCISIWSDLTEQALDRHSLLIVLGGGVLGDMGGFCAATFKRGIDFVLIPTTLLAQVDASIGGKLGIDFKHFKNHIGVFQLPALTLLHSGFLQTLPKAELRSGFAEILKHALISDAAVWKEIIGKSLEQQDWNRLIQHSVAFKAFVTTEDPKEKGLRKILNAGHTIGHALESYLLGAGRKILHGEAVAAGLVAESYIASKRGLLSDSSFQEITDYIVKIFGKAEFKESDVADIATLTTQDKKNKENRILCVLLDGIGSAQLNCEVSLEEVKGALSFYRSVQM